MGPFLPLFFVEVEHGYFPAGICRGLRLEASSNTLHTLARSACMLRETDRGLLLAFDAATANALHMHADDTDTPLRFDFLARVADPHFANYTEGCFGSARALPMFDTRQAVAEELSGRLRLHAGKCAGTGDEQALDSTWAAHVLSARDRRAPPHFTVSVHVDAAMVADAAGQRPRRFLVRLQPRATVWKYVLVGDFTDTGEDVRVVDLGETCDFDTGVGERLPDGQDVLAVRSRAPITLQQRSAQRFQLRRSGTGTDKVLIKRLPVASPSLISRETLGGVPTWVSEIYVHR